MEIFLAYDDFIKNYRRGRGTARYHKYITTINSDRKAYTWWCSKNIVFLDAKYVSRFDVFFGYCYRSTFAIEDHHITTTTVTVYDVSNYIRMFISITVLRTLLDPY